MMCFILILALLLPRTPEARNLVVVLVEPAGETFTADEQTTALDGIRAALAFWQDHAPDPVPIVWTATEFITTTAPMTDSLDWSIPYWGNPADVTLFVIDSPYPLIGDAVGEAQTLMGIIWVLRGEGSWYAATVAHELGHVVYHLPHAYADPYDIMNLFPPAAYERGTIGCTSLAQLNRPCSRFYVPMITT